MSSTVYVKLTSAASGSQWNPVFPTPGQNNSSKGFYAQWDAIDAAFQETANELSSLQNLVLAFSGDASGTSPAFGTAPLIGGVPTLSVPVNLSQTGVVAGTYDSAGGTISITVDAQGRIHAASITAKQITGYTANQVLAPTGQIGTGTGTITFPTVTFDSTGALSSASNTTIPYGLMGQTLAQNAFLIGNSSNQTSVFTAPTDAAQYYLTCNNGTVAWATRTSDIPASPSTTDGKTYTLQETNGTMSWSVLSIPNPLPATPNDTTNTYTLQEKNGTLAWNLISTGSQGTLTGLTAGKGIAINNVNPDAPTVSLAYKANTTQMTPAGSNPSTDYIGITNNSGVLYWVTVQDAQSMFSRVSADTTPYLSAPLDMGPNGGIMTSQPHIGVSISSYAAALGQPNATLNLSQDRGFVVTTQNSKPISLNGTNWPSTAGSQGQYLSLGASGQLVWTNLPTAAAFNQTVSNTIFVGPNGDDTNGVGSLNNPYLTINKAAKALSTSASAIQTIMLLGGTYTEDVTLQQIPNVSIEGFFASTPSIVKGSVTLAIGITSFYMSNVRVTLEDRDATYGQPVFAITANIGSVQIKDCQLLRGGTDELSALQVIYLNGANTYDVTFTNTMIQGTIVNQMISQNGSRVVVNNSILPATGYVGLQTQPNTFTYLNGVPLVRGVHHSGGILNMTNVDSIRPLPYQVSVDQPSYPVWDSNNKPLFEDQNGNSVEEDPNNPGNGLASTSPDGKSYPLQVNTGPDGLAQEVNLLDANGDPIEDPNHLNTQPKTYLTTTNIQSETDPAPVVTTYNVGLFSDCGIAQNGAGENSLTLNNVNFYYQGDFSPIYKSGNLDDGTSCPWSFTRVKRRADQDYITGARIAYDVMPDEGQFLARYIASGTNLTLESGGGTVPGSYIDPASGNTFHVTLKNTSNILLHTPDATTYSSEMYAELVMAVYQDVASGGNWSVSFSTDNNTNIIWLGGTDVNLNPGSYTFYTFRYLSTTRKWIGQKQDDGTTRKVDTVTITSDYTLKSSDVGAYVRRFGTTANNVVIPNSSTVNYALGTQIDIVQTGKGQTSVKPAAGVVINTPFGYALRAQFSRATLIKVSDNVWDLSGDLDNTKTVAQQTTVDTTTITADSNKTTTDGKTTA